MSSTASIANSKRLEGCSMATALSMDPTGLRAFHAEGDAPNPVHFALDSSRAEAAGAALGRLQAGLLRPLQPGHRRHHQLRDPVAALQGEDFMPVVDQDDAD